MSEGSRIYYNFVLWEKHNIYIILVYIYKHLNSQGLS